MRKITIETNEFQPVIDVLFKLKLNFKLDTERRLFILGLPIKRTAELITTLENKYQESKTFKYYAKESKPYCNLNF